MIRAAAMALRICGGLALILGLVVWLLHIEGILVPIHMLLGLLVALSLAILGYAITAIRGGSLGMGIGAFVLAILVIVLGLTQQSLLIGDLHWIVQVVHLLLGVGAIGMGEIINRRYSSITKA
ncbi:MAG: hypothetical protein IMW89_11975 [Ktedonobacteraceae bacterium]|nr:hypothetical protein [Ktedonobacteraceae bacterium]